MTTDANFSEFEMLIGGELMGSESGEWIESIDPSNEEVIGRVPAGSRSDVDRAVAAASSAVPSWAATDAPERAAQLRELSQQLRRHKEPIVELEVADTGNTIKEMEADVDRGADALDYFAGLALETKGETIPATASSLHLSLREPYGVVGRIIPFNHPIMFAAQKIAAPLTAGNCVVVKPSEHSPLSALYFARICGEVLPPGVVNFVTGYGHTAGDALVRHRNVKRLAFTGSVGAGLAIQRAAAESSVKHVSLELGGKNPMIVFPDADMPSALSSAIRGMNFSWQGQSCGSTSRLFIHKSMYDGAVDWLRETVEKLRIGDPRDRTTDVGPVNSLAQYEKDCRYIEIGKEEGARLITGGGRPTGHDFTKGYWLKPTVFADVTPAMRIFREEIFGPVLSVICWEDEDQVLNMANDSEYGLTAAVWTESLRTAVTVARRLEAGYVWINGSAAHYPGCSFGGKKNSSVGTEEGLEDLLSYTENKTIHLVV
jgi:aldehyde dehydrogenase (NAD+)/betaine-aldehyde dehydrogenase